MRNRNEWIESYQDIEVDDTSLSVGLSLTRWQTRAELHWAEMNVYHEIERNEHNYQYIYLAGASSSAGSGVAR